MVGAQGGAWLVGASFRVWVIELFRAVGVGPVFCRYGFTIEVVTAVALFLGWWFGVCCAQRNMRRQARCVARKSPAGPPGGLPEKVPRSPGRGRRRAAGGEKNAIKCAKIRLKEPSNELRLDDSGRV